MNFVKRLQELMVKDGWRQCAKGQTTTQYCGIAEQARLEEREACAQLAESMELERPSGSSMYSGDVAKAIRNRR